jgi:hypothetical protein
MTLGICIGLGKYLAIYLIYIDHKHQMNLKILRSHPLYKTSRDAKGKFLKIHTVLPHVLCILWGNKSVYDG